VKKTLRTHVLAALAFATLLVAGRPVRAEDPPADWVAQCGGQILTMRGLAAVAVDRVGAELLEMASGPLSILRVMVQENMVAQEAKTLGVAVSEAEVDRSWSDLARTVHTQSGGTKTLDDVIREQGSTVRETRDNLREQLLKEKVAAHPKYLGKTLPTDAKTRIAQAEIVAEQIAKTATVRFGIPVAMQPEAVDLGPDVVAEVSLPNRAPERITRRDFGLALVRRLPADRVREMIEQECQSVLTKSMALTEEEMATAIEEERVRWNDWRKQTEQIAFRDVSYDDWVKMKYRLSLEDLRKDRYFRGQFGLLRHFRQAVEADPATVRAEYEKAREGMYGEAYEVSDVQISFLQENALINPQRQRTRKEALRIANDLLSKSATGVSFDMLMREVNDARDPTFRAQRRLLRNTDNDRLLYEQVRQLKDGETTRTETLSEVHVLRRERHVPAPSFEEVRSHVVERLTNLRAREWLQARMTDESTVRIRWPLPQ
jgi:hypothetical protein